MFDPRTLPDGAFWPNLGLFVTIAVMLGAQLADFITTIKGMDKGLVEGNPVSRFLFKHLGKAGGAFAGMMATLMTTFLFLAIGGIAPATAYAGIIAAAETVMAIRNYKLLSK